MPIIAVETSLGGRLTVGFDTVADMWEAFRRIEGLFLKLGKLQPVHMILHCPTCHEQHIDAPNLEIGWTNPPHRSHLCAYCKAIWRPADIATNGVLGIRTRGKKDTWSIVINDQGVRQEYADH